MDQNAKSYETYATFVRIPSYLHHTEMLAYLEAFTNPFDLRRYIQFRSPVICAHLLVNQHQRRIDGTSDSSLVTTMLGDRIADLFGHARQMAIPSPSLPQPGPSEGPESASFHPCSSCSASRIKSEPSWRTSRAMAAGPGSGPGRFKIMIGGILLIRSRT